VPSLLTCLRTMIKIIDRVDFESPHYPARSIGINIVDDDLSNKKFVLVASDLVTNMDVVIPLTMLDLNLIIEKLIAAKEKCPDQTVYAQDDVTEACAITSEMFDE
jgi:hypothetical protein